MSKNDLDIKDETKKGVYILRLEGDITRETGDELLKWKVWESGLEDGAEFLLVDFSKVSYINSAGIAALIRLFRFGSKGLFKAMGFGLHYHYEKMFAMVGLNKYLELYPNEWIILDKLKSGNM